MKIIKILFIKIVKLYQIGISPWIGNNCRYIPTCSNYMILSLKRWNLFKALFISIIRIIKCNPLGPSDFNPKKTI
ncbi:membrane protein insertion efficiency factor YidD [Blattabacterium cuenoti]|uniref:membrane protein insertion efficiency factor YidD n=1 Tax=Blattabacterium cuenoti TaxID=1653831 RepID=UPI00163BA9A6|nr:membrane protein insertion efficiency factor YidD [Blattabacterium cuenoti]